MKFIQERSWDQNLWGSEGRRTGQKETLGCDESQQRPRSTLPGAGATMAAQSCPRLGPLYLYIDQSGDVTALGWRDDLAGAESLQRTVILRECLKVMGRGSAVSYPPSTLLSAGRLGAPVLKWRWGWISVADQSRLAHVTLRRPYEGIAPSSQA